MRNLVLVILFLSFSLFSISQDNVPSFLKDSLDQYVNRALVEWKIPGAAVCVVKDGKVVWMKGYGLKEVGSSEKVDENTLFMIGSNTKAFTATALAMLHSRKKLSLDDRVQKWLPDFKLFDPWVAKETNIRDLLCHRLGFETFQGDFMYFDSDLTKDEVKEKMSKLKPLYSFRGKWGYCNSAFMIAGEIFPKVTGKTWAEFLTDSIFRPLNMNRTIALSAGITSATNKASAHTVTNGILKKVSYGNIDNLAPAGSISSSINDMSNWVLMHLNEGKHQGKQLLSNSAIYQTWLPHSILGNGNVLHNKGHFLLYGLGWMLQEYNGRKIVAHTGGVNGFVTSVTLLPEEELGIIVLTNTDANNFFEALKWEIMDAYMGLPYRNYSSTYLGFHQQSQNDAAEWLKLKKDTVSTASDALPLSLYAGDYEHEVYGKMKITLENGKLISRFEHHKGREAVLELLSRGRFLATFNDPLYGVNEWKFSLDKEKVKSVTVRVADFVEFTPYEFYKK
jgi:CubicO group peptidase (beta-lactamase class C family)